MKAMVFALVTLVTSSVWAASSVSSIIKCANERGVVLEIKQKIGDIYKVSLNDQIVYDALVVTQSENSFAVSALDSKNPNTILSAGYDFKRKEAFYSRSANGGMSPLPALFFTNCTVR